MMELPKPYNEEKSADKESTIEVGDVVTNGRITGIFLSWGENGDDEECAIVCNKNGDNLILKDECRKTGKHIDLDKLLGE